MATIKWRSGEVPEGMEIRQVYGIIFTKDGRILLRTYVEKGKRKYSFAGGTPESYDRDVEETLKRELLEEINTTIGNPLLIGYQEINEENNTPLYAQLRMVAIIEEIGEKRPDPDNGEIYDRLLTTPLKAIELLNWGEVGKTQIEEGFEIAKKKLGLKVSSSIEEYL